MTVIHTMQGRRIFIPPIIRKQRGVALFAVIVFLMLSMLLALWASRTSLFGEMIVGNDADYQRAFEAAEALLQDAELDIRGEQSDGTPCIGNGKVCRHGGSALEIPLENKDVGVLLTKLDAENLKCKDGLCIKRSGKQNFWDDETTLKNMIKANVGARYGEYTGAKTGDNANPILARTGQKEGGWYWIEVLPYEKSSENAGLITTETVNADGSRTYGSVNNFLALNLEPYVVYRITALAYGLKANTRVILQQTYAWQKLRD